MRDRNRGVRPRQNREEAAASQEEKANGPEQTLRNALKTEALRNRGDSPGYGQNGREDGANSSGQA
ncbi:hypothetical protein F4V43_11050 [Paenibacillus spiritus]|uniref:Uncharacterized protein n=1 Tax=Paenibacillus spiritus TaxID=2496557 RepID=A0A5J5G893_9BACL|nr:hypothetical protein [Paenibacillus spiritus]KAA9003946.1 hypothetical protein F4V43_11050 [Paenibacillus spiritus]